MSGSFCFFLPEERNRKPGEYFAPYRGNYWRGDDNPVRMEIKERSNVVELWLNRDEKNDQQFLESLKPLYRQYQAQHYLVAVFYSGEEDLYQQTRDLLLYNRRRAAERKVREWGRMAMTE